MRTFGHILLGMLLGIILLVVAIGGAVYGLISVPVGDLQNTFNLQILPQDNPLITQTILEIIQSAISDVQNMNTLPVRTVLDKYGIKLPDDVMPVIEPLLDVKVGDLINDPNKALDDVVDKVTLNSIVDIANIDKASLTKYPILAENMDKNVASAMKSFTDLLDANTLTIRGLKDNLGFTLGEMELLDEVQDLPINNFADAIQTIEIGTVLGVDTDKFIPNKDVKIFAKVDRFEPVTETLNPYATTYLAAIQDGKQVKKELHFVLKNQPETAAQTTADVVISQNKDDYKVDNGESTVENPKSFYRFVEYEPYDPAKHADAPLFVGTVINSFIQSGTNFIPKESVMLAADKLYLSDTLTLEAEIKNPTMLTIFDGKISVLNDVKYSVVDELTNETKLFDAPHYGYTGDATADTVLAENQNGFLRIYAGTSDMAIQHLSGLTINELSQNPTDKIMTLKLSDVLKDIKEDNPLYSLKDSMLKDIPDEIKTLKVGDVITDIKVGAYTENPDGDYVFVDGIYTFYNKDKHDSSLKHYDYHEEYCVATEAEIKDATIGKFIIQANNIVSQTQDQVNANLEQTYYVAGTASSRLLQRMATTDLNGITSLIDTIALGDVMPIDENNMLYALAGCTINEIPEKIDTLSIDDVLKGIKIGAYTPNPNGAYFFDGSCYTIYNPAIHTVTSEHGRFDYHNDYYVATKKEISDASLIKFIFDGKDFVLKSQEDINNTPKQTYYVGFHVASLDEVATTAITKYILDGSCFISQTQDQVNAAPTTKYYVKEEASSKILQRIAKTQLNGLGTLMDSLVLGDVIDLDLDTYVQTTSLPGDFYYFEDNMYKRAFKEGSEFKDKTGTKVIPNDKIYQISKEGSSHAIIKKLATTSINNMGNVFTTLMEELYFTDIIDVVIKSEYYETKPDESIDKTKEGYFVAADQIDQNAAYVYDANGKYYQSNVKYYPIDKANFKTITKKFDYVSLSTIKMILPTLSNPKETKTFEIDFSKSLHDGEDLIPDAAMTYKAALLLKVVELISSNNIFVHNGESYLFNIPYALYKANKYDYSSLFTSVENQLSGANSYEAIVVEANDVLYAELLGGYIEYDNSTPAHSMLPIAARFTDGLYPASGDQFVTKYLYKDGTIGDAKIEGEIAYSLTQLNPIASGKYYYNKINEYTYLAAIPGLPEGTLTDKDTEFRYKEGDTLFAKKQTSEMLKVSLDGTKKTTVTSIGYLTHDKNEVENSGVQLFGSKTVYISKEQSATLLCSLASSKYTITDFDEILKTFTLNQLVDMEPNSFLGQLGNVKLDNLSAEIPNKLNSITIGQMVEMLDITTINGNVLSLVKDLTFPEFLGSITVNDEGSITFDMNKIFANGSKIKP